MLDLLDDLLCWVVPDKRLEIVVPMFSSEFYRVFELIDGVVCTTV
jgi:hypothetical protein